MKDVQLGDCGVRELKQDIDDGEELAESDVFAAEAVFAGARGQLRDMPRQGE